MLAAFCMFVVSAGTYGQAAPSKEQSICLVLLGTCIW